MIIQRRYEWLGVLYENDPLSKAAIDRAFAMENIDEDRKKMLIDYNHYNIPAFLNLGCGIPGMCYSHFMDEFVSLDKIAPYDNGLTFNDVSTIEFETSPKGTAIQCRFINQFADCPYRIVGFAAIKDKKPGFTLIKGWDMKQPCEIG